MMCEGVSVLRSLGASLRHDPLIRQPHRLKRRGRVRDLPAPLSRIINNGLKNQELFPRNRPKNVFQVL